METQIFQYTDYREYLRDWFDEKKQSNPRFSYRIFAQKAGYNSSGYYQNVVKGTNRLSKAYLLKFVKAMSLDTKEAKYFEYLLEFNHAKKSEDKEKYYNLMTALIPVDLFRFKALHREFYSKWYHAPVLKSLELIEITSLDQFSPIQDFIYPKLKEVEITESLQLLYSLNMIEQNQGRWMPKFENVIGGAEVGVKAIRHYQELMIERSKFALNYYDPSLRFFENQTLTISRQDVPEIQSVLREAREKIRSIVSQSEDHNQLYHLNFQLFPLSKINEELS